jgi:hypothetical protein
MRCRRTFSPDCLLKIRQVPDVADLGLAFHRARAWAGEMAVQPVRLQRDEAMVPLNQRSPRRPAADDVPVTARHRLVWVGTTAVKSVWPMILCVLRPKTAGQGRCHGVPRPTATHRPRRPRSPRPEDGARSPGRGRGLATGFG